MESERHFIIHKIIKDGTHWSNPTIDTDKMIKFIEEYGVNYTQKHNSGRYDRLLKYHTWMSEEQMDILASYKPSINSDDGIISLGCFLPQTLYMFKKLLEIDDKLDFILENLEGSDCTYKEYIKSVLFPKYDIPDYKPTLETLEIGLKMLALLEEHELKIKLVD